jgi:hypothetical protein
VPAMARVAVPTAGRSFSSEAPVEQQNSDVRRPLLLVDGDELEHAEPFAAPDQDDFAGVDVVGVCGVAGLRAVLPVALVAEHRASVRCACDRGRRARRAYRVRLQEGVRRSPPVLGGRRCPPRVTG